MPLDIAAIQRCLAADRMDGWLLYDFHGANPIAAGVAGVLGRHTTRRWFYFIPVTGAPVKILHAIEPRVLDGLPGATRLYAGRQALEREVGALMRGLRTVAMEYSPAGAIPYVSRVDAGTVELIRSFGPNVVSSGDLVGRFEAAWDPAAIASHRAAAERLYRVKDRTFDYVRAKLSGGDAVSEWEVQQMMLQEFKTEGLVADAPPIVAAQEHTSNPHYEPKASSSRPIRQDEILLLDLWGKLDEPRAVYADITWMGFAGTPPTAVAAVFALALAARDAAVELVKTRVAAAESIEGWEVDRAARGVIEAGGYGDQFIHRTGHSLGEEVHGNGVHMDDYETHDDRHLLAGTGFTIEPGIYTREFGVRTEINMVVGATSAEVTGPCQRELVNFAPRR